MQHILKINSCEDSAKAVAQLANQNVKKSTEQQYIEICKALSNNYVSTNAHSHTKSNFSKSSTSKKNIMQICADNCSVGNQTNFRNTDQFNQAIQINKFFKVGDMLGSQQKINSHPFEQSVNNKQNAYNSKTAHNFAIFQRTYSAKPKKMTIQSAKVSSKISMQRPMTNNQPRIKSSLFHDNHQKNYKFVQVFKKGATSQIRKLKKSVDDLENIALTKYGIGQFRTQTRKSQQDDQFLWDANFNMDNINKKLKQFKSNQIQNECESEKQDFVPTSIMRSLFSAKSRIRDGGIMRTKPTAQYLRV